MKYHLQWRAPRGSRWWIAIAAVGAVAAGASTAFAVCNVIPASDRTFPSTLGSISTPFAKPGQEVSLTREIAVFPEDPAQNAVTLEFRPPGGPVTIVNIPALAPDGDSECRPDACSAGLCRCVRFAMPDTDTQVGLPADGRGLAGPVYVIAEAGGVETARIDDLLLPQTRFRDDLFPSFMALPPSNAFVALTQGPGPEVLGAVDATGLVFIPLGFGPLVPADQSQTRFVNVTMPGTITLSSLELDAFTTTGGRLPPLLRALGVADIVGTVDGPESVFRIAGVPSGPLRTPFEGTGPVVIPGVSGTADPRKRGDAFTLHAGAHWSIYENRECGLQDPLNDCMDLNGDSDQRDYLLYALDMTTPNAEPVLIDEIDAGTLAGYPANFTPTPLYHFVSSDDVVAFEISEDGSADLNDDGDTLDIVRAGAFDLRRGTRVNAADDAVRLELDGTLLAFAVTVDDAAAKDVLYYYDAAQPSPGPIPVSNPENPQFYLYRLIPELQPYVVSRLSPVNTYNLDVAAGRIAFMVDEAVQGTNLSGLPEFEDVVVLLWDPVNGVQDLHVAVPLDGNIRLTSRWIAFNKGADFGTWVDLRPLSNLQGGDAVCFDFRDPAPGQTRLFFGSLWGEPSEDFLTCAMSEFTVDGLGNEDRNGDGDVTDVTLWREDLRGWDGEFILGTSLPLAVNVEGTNLGYRPVAHGSFLAAPVDEAAQGQDLDGDGLIGSPFPSSPPVLQLVDLTDDRILNLRQHVAPTDPRLERFNLRFFDDGLSFVTPSGNTTFLRDLDHDGHFEEVVFDPVLGHERALDNCPLVANSSQQDDDGDGIGNACETFICLPAPDPSCIAPVAPGQTQVQLKLGATPNENVVDWKWNTKLGVSMGPLATGTEVPGTTYHLCMYDGTGRLLDLAVPSGTICGTHPCWRTNSHGDLKYTSKAEGVQKISVKIRAGKPNVRVKAKGGPVTLPALPLSSAPLTVQFGNELGTCIQASYAFPLARKNDSRQFVDRDD